MDNAYNLNENLFLNDYFINNDTNFYDNCDDINNVDSFISYDDFEYNCPSSTSDDFLTSLCSSETFDKKSITADEEQSISRISNDDSLSLWSDDSTGVNFDEFSSINSPMWNALDTDNETGNAGISENDSQPPNLIAEPSTTFVHAYDSSSQCIMQPIYIPSPTNIIKMTVLPSKTTVHEAIKAAGIGQYSRKVGNINNNARQILIVNQVEPQFAVFQPMIVCKNEKSVINTEDEDWDKDMPVLTPEKPISSFDFKDIKPKQEFVCDICNRKLFTKHALAKHKHLHQPPRFQCGRCNKMFYDRSKLRRHQLVHTGEKKFKCNICQKNFSLEYNLRAHIKMHKLNENRRSGANNDVNDHI